MDRQGGRNNLKQEKRGSKHEVFRLDMQRVVVYDEEEELDLMFRRFSRLLLEKGKEQTRRRPRGRTPKSAAIKQPKNIQTKKKRSRKIT